MLLSFELSIKYYFVCTREKNLKELLEKGDLEDAREKN